MGLAFKPVSSQHFRVVCGEVRAAGVNWPSFTIGIYRMIQQFVKRLAVMYRRIGYCTSLYRNIIFVRIYMVLWPQCFYDVTHR
ncbi:hypothetical protein NTG1052_440029 [Candidatus Nitrotoga sp. 1052]|nr:hypothetical protein NTG1052_440029 [Candidatus Nitrotoga sp. 1052]